MSTIDNLNSIYTSKISIKTVLGTESDDFENYGTYVTNNITASYNSGYASGYATGYDIGYADGQAAAGPDYSQEYFTIEPLEDSCEITITKNTNAPNKTWYYSKDKTNWSNFSATTTITANSNEKVYFYSTGAMTTISNNTPQYYWQINASKQFNVSGNIMSLLFGTNFVGQTSLANYKGAFYQLFRSYGITSTIVDASNLILPATTLSFHCYAYMFINCDSLIKAPKLPATTLVWACYDHMFQQCYALNEIICLAKSANGSNSSYTCDGWLYQVAASGTFTKNSDSGSFWTTGTNGIPSNWTVIETAA